MDSLNVDQPFAPTKKRTRITTSRKPDVWFCGGRHYFINGVVRVSGLESKNVTALTEEETVRFFEDWKSLSESELGQKYEKNSITSDAEVDKLMEG